MLLVKLAVLTVCWVDLRILVRYDVSNLPHTLFSISLVPRLLAQH